MPSVLDFASNSGFNALLAGAAINQYDLVEMGPDGLAWPCSVTDYAKVANQGSTVVAETTVSTLIPTGAASPLRQAVYQEPTKKNLYIAAAQNSSNGIVIYKYAPGGALIGSIALDSSANALYSPKIQALSTGNLLVTWVAAASGNITFAIIDINLAVIKSATTIEAANQQNYDSLALSGGGFAVSYLKQGTVTERLAIYDNTGAVASAAATIQTWTGTPGPVTVKLAQLSNGNIVIACGSGYTTTVGTYFAIYNTAGVQQVAFTNIDTQATSPVELAVMTGFWIILNVSSGGNLAAHVLSNAGAVQGTPLSLSASVSSNAFRALTDGVNFFVVYNAASGFNFLVALVTTGGVLSLTYTGGTTTTAANCDAFIERGRLVVLTNQDNSPVQWAFFVVNLSTGVLEKATTNIGTAAAATGSDARVIPGGDFTFIALYANTSSAALKFFIGKYQNSGIQGPSGTSVAAGSNTYVRTGAVTSVINQLLGSPSLTVDHSAANIPGRKGAIGAQGVVFTG
jgi:hypothetical protein